MFAAIFSPTADAATSKLPTDEAHILVTTPDGTVRTLPARDGTTFMELIPRGGDRRAAGSLWRCLLMRDLPCPVAPAWASALPAVGATEAALIEAIESATPFSRLSCQLPFSATLNGLAVSIAQAE